MLGMPRTRHAPSADFPLRNPIQAVYKGEGDAFILKIADIKFIPTPVPTNMPEPTRTPPPPTPTPTGVVALVQSDLFLYVIFGMIGLVILFFIVELIQSLIKRRRKQ